MFIHVSTVVLENAVIPSGNGTMRDTAQKL